MKIKLSHLIIIFSVFLCISIGSYLIHKYIRINSHNKQVELQKEEKRENYRRIIAAQKGIYLCYQESMAIKPTANYKGYNIEIKWKVLVPIMGNELQPNEYFWGIGWVDDPPTTKSLFHFLRNQSMHGSSCFIVVLDGDIHEVNNEKRAWAIPIELDYTESSRIFQSLLEDVDLWKNSHDIPLKSDNDIDKKLNR